MARSTKKPVFPFLRANPEHVFAHPWCTYDGKALGEFIPDWDYQAEIHLIREVVIDTPAIIKECALPDDAVLRLSIIAKSAASGEKTCCFSHSFKSTGHPEEVPIEVRIKDGTMGKALELSTLLVLGNVGSSVSPLSPQQPGSVIWDEHREILLESTGARFPIEVVDFPEVGWLPPAAGWFLDWSPDFLEQSFLGTVRLLINSRHAAVMKAVTNHDPDDADRAILSGIYYETGKSLILGALGNEDFSETDSQYPEGSVGRLIDNMLRLYYPGESWQALRQRAQADTEEFNASLRDCLRLFRFRDEEVE